MSDKMNGMIKSVFVTKKVFKSVIWSKSITEVVNYEDNKRGSENNR